MIELAAVGQSQDPEWVQIETEKGVISAESVIISQKIAWQPK